MLQESETVTQKLLQMLNSDSCINPRGSCHTWEEKEVEIRNRQQLSFERKRIHEPTMSMSFSICPVLSLDIREGKEITETVIKLEAMGSSRSLQTPKMYNGLVASHWGGLC